MARLIALLLVFSIAGVLIAGAQCKTFCTAKQCGAPRTSPGCHHNSRPSDVPRCLHQQGLPHAWLVTSLENAARPLIAIAALPPTQLRLPRAEPSRERTILAAKADQPSEPPHHTALRI